MDTIQLKGHFTLREYILCENVQGKLCRNV